MPEKVWEEAVGFERQTPSFGVLALFFQEECCNKARRKLGGIVVMDACQIKGRCNASRIAIQERRLAQVGAFQPRPIEQGVLQVGPR